MAGSADVAIECDGCGTPLRYGHERHVCQSRRPPVWPMTAEELADHEAMVAAMRTVNFRYCKGYCNPTELKTFKRLWKEHKETGKRKALDAFIAWANARPPFQKCFEKKEGE